jgi:hypothetical protein
MENYLKENETEKKMKLMDPWFAGDFWVLRVM